MLALALTAQILVVLDISVVNTALPTIGRSLHLASSDLQWMVTAYLLMSGGGLLLGGRIADLLPRHRVFMTGMFVFTAASLVSGFASSASEIVLARGAQGVGAALMTPAALSLIMTTYSGAQRAKALTLWGAVGGLGIAAGVVVGGALTTWAGWQSIFWVNVPVGVIALAVATRVLPRHTTTPARLAGFDLAGAATAVGGLAALMFALAGAPSHGWTSARTITALAVSAVLLGGFTLVERRVAQPLRPPAHVVVAVAGLRHGRHAGRHRSPGRRGVPRLDLRPDRARVLGAAGRPGLPAARPRADRRHPRRRPSGRPRHGPDRRRDRPRGRHRRSGPALPGLGRRLLRRRRAARACSSSGSAPAWSSSRSPPRR